MTENKKLYQLYHPRGLWDTTQYLVVIQDGPKTYGYIKIGTACAKYQQNQTIFKVS